MSEADERHWDDRFRELVETLVSRRTESVASELNGFQSTFNAVCTRLVEQARSSNAQEIETITRELHERLAASERVSQDREQNVKSTLEKRHRAERANLNASIAEIDRQRTQAGVLGATIEAASAFADRVALFVVRGGNVVGWRQIGFGDQADSITSISRSLNDRTLLGDAIGQRQSVALNGEADLAAVEFLGSLAPAGSLNAVAVPLVVRDKAAAVLYADAGGDIPVDTHPLEALMRVATMAIELLPLRRSLEPSGAEPPAPRVLTSTITSQIVPAGESLRTETHRLAARDPEPDAASTPVEEVAEAEPTETWPKGLVQAESAPVNLRAPAELTAPSDLQTTAPASDTSAGDISTPEFSGTDHSESALQEPPAVSAPVDSFLPEPVPEAHEEQTEGLRDAVVEPPIGDFVQPAASVAEAFVAPVERLEEARQNGTSIVIETIDPDGTDPRDHLNARRFARFLIGEIRLYQPSRVLEGCRRADLYDRLRDEIERSRKLYERHVRPQITAEFDYFYHELITTLAEGDATKLGRNFPVPIL